jgi:hypothetical protein
MVAVAHAGRLIEQDDDLARAAADRGGDRALVEEGARKGGDDERDRGRAHQQQRPVPDAPAPHRLIRNAAHEHQRRKLDDALLLALNQVNQHRDGDRAEADQEKWRQECHDGLT